MIKKTFNIIFISIIILIALILIFKFIYFINFAIAKKIPIYTIFCKLGISSLLPLSAFGALIGYYQYGLQTERFKKELFEERLNVFNILEKIVSTVFHNTENMEDIFYDELNKNINKSYFLFDHKTYNFIKEFRRKCINFSCARKAYRPYEEMDWGSITNPELFERIKKLDKEIQDNWHWIIEFNNVDKLAAKFPQLKFH